MLCWKGNPDAMIGWMSSGGKHYIDRHPQLYLTRVFGLVSLRLFYNYGRLPMVFYGDLRVDNYSLAHDSDWVKSELGYHCKFCGSVIKNRWERKFCSHSCMNSYLKLFIQYDCWAWFRDRVFKRDNYICKMCGKTHSNLICDHIVPLFKGGKDWWEDKEMTNFQTLCEDCNKIKTRADMSKPKVFNLGWLFPDPVEPVDYPLSKYMELPK
jgi:hypothetical protein